MRGDYYNSRRYHSFFEGYTEAVVEKNGKKKIERVYTGDYYRARLTREEQRNRKILYAVLYVIAVFLYAYMSVQPYAINLSRIAAICQGLLLVDLLWILVCLADYIRSGEKMSLRTYRISSQRLLFLSPAAVVLFALLGVGYVAQTVLLSAPLTELLLLFPASAVGAVVMAIVYRQERDTEYERLPNDTEPIKDGKKIEF